MTGYENAEKALRILSKIADRATQVARTSETLQAFIIHGVGQRLQGEKLGEIIENYDEMQGFVDELREMHGGNEEC